MARDKHRGAALSRVKTNSVPQGLASLQHVGHAVLGQALAGQADKDLALEVQQVLLIYGRAAVGATAASEHMRETLGDVGIVLGDLARHAKAGDGGLDGELPTLAG